MTLRAITLYDIVPWETSSFRDSRTLAAVPARRGDFREWTEAKGETKAAELCWLHRHRHSLEGAAGRLGRVAGVHPWATSAAPWAKETPQEAPGPRAPPAASLPPARPRARVILTSLFPLRMGTHTPLQTPGSLAHPGDTRSLWKTQSLATTGSWLCSLGDPPSPPPRSWAGSECQQ